MDKKGDKLVTFMNSTKNNAKLFLLLFYSEAIIPEKNWLKVAPSLILEHLAVTNFPS